MSHTLQIIDDEDFAITLLENYIKESGLDLDIQTSSNSVEVAIKNIDQFKPDIILLDIKINDKTGFDVLEGISHHPLVIFTTAYDNFAIKAIKNDAVDYVMKPIDKQELVDALKKAMQLNAKNKEVVDSSITNDSNRRIKFPNGDLIPIQDIIYCKAEGNYTRVYLKDHKDVLIAKTLKKLEKELSSDTFLRTHQSHLVNVEFCDSINTHTVTITGIPPIPVSRSKRQEVVDALTNKGIF